MNVLIPQAELAKKSFTQTFNAFKERGGDGLEPDGFLQLTPGTKDTDPKWQARYKVDAPSSLPPDESTIAARKAAVEQLKKAMDSEIGPEGTARVFQSLGLEGAGELSGRNLLKLEGAFIGVRNEMVQALQNENRPTVTKWQDISKKGGVTVDPATEMTLEQLLDHPEAEWSISKAGGTGALIVKMPGGKGAVVKIESNEATEKVGKLSELMQGTMPSGPRGFNVPKVETLGDLTQQDATVKKLISKLEEIRTTVDNPVLLNRLDGHLNKLRDTANLGDHGVSKMEFVPGVQLNELPLDDRVAMIQSGRLAEQLGKANLFCPMTGLNDHLTTRSEGTTNLSNFMMDPNTGKLAPIDLDSVNLAGEGQTPFFGSPGSSEGLKSIIDFTKNATEDPLKLQTAMEQMIAEQSTGVALNTPYAQALKSITDPQACEGLIKPSTSDSRLTKDILASSMTREKQALSMMRGTLEGLKELKENKESLKEAFTSQKQGMKPEEFDEISQKVDGLDFDKMEQQLDAYELEMNKRHAQTAQIKRDQQAIEARKPVQPELDKLAKQQQKLERLENNPTNGDKLKAFFTKGGMEKLKTEAKLDIEKTKLEIAAKSSPETYQARLDGNKERLEKLQEAKQNALPVGKGDLKAKADLKQLDKEVKMAEKVVAVGEKHKTVREEMAKGPSVKKSGPKQEVAVKGHGV